MHVRARVCVCACVWVHVGGVRWCVRVYVPTPRLDRVRPGIGEGSAHSIEHISPDSGGCCARSSCATARQRRGKRQGKKARQGKQTRQDKARQRRAQRTPTHKAKKEKKKNKRERKDVK